MTRPILRIATAAGSGVDLPQGRPSVSGYGQARSLLEYVCTIGDVPLIGQLILLGKEDGWDGAWASTWI